MSYSSALITGEQLINILELDLREIKLDQYVRVRRLGVSHENAVDVISFNYMRVRDYATALELMLTHEKIMKLANEGFDLYDINTCLIEGYSLASAKEASKDMVINEYVLLRKRKITHRRVMEFAQLRRDGEWKKWKYFIHHVQAGEDPESAFVKACSLPY